MIYLVLAVICSMLVSVLMRVSEKHAGDSMGKLAMNYLMCCVLGWLFTGGVQLFPNEPGLAGTVGMGAINGVFYLGGFVMLQWNIARNGVVLPATFMRLGVLVPTLLSIIVFGETPELAQVLGIIAAVAAIFIMQGGKGDKGTARSIPGLILLMLAGGSADAMSKVFEEAGSAALKDQFLLYTFMSALVLCVVLCIVRRQKPGVMDVVFGMLIGVPNYLSSRFLLLSLADVPAMIAYPTYSVGTIIMIALVGVAVFREKLDRRKLIAIGVILAALVLLNI